MTDWVELTRDCHGIQVPYGNSLTVRRGTEVVVTQKLGDTLTVETRTGYLVRLDARDADALGLDLDTAEAAADDGPLTEDRVWDVLRTCFDPEIPVNIVELGLIYGCRLTPLADGRYRVVVDLTLTAPGCGMGDILKDDIERKVGALSGVAEAHVELVLDPPWDVSRMSEAARLETGLM
jgi:probable FeS assembly SUF system protein SufT